jgi:hypothetical protein
LNASVSLTYFGFQLLRNSPYCPYITKFDRDTELKEFDFSFWPWGNPNLVCGPFLSVAVHSESGRVPQKSELKKLFSCTLMYILPPKQSTKFYWCQKWAFGFASSEIFH